MNKSNKSTIFDCNVIDLPKVENPAGSITALNGGIDLPFEIERIYYLYDVPGGEKRGGHAHKKLEQYLVAASGSFDVLLYDGEEQKKVSLNRPNKALHIVPGIWRELENFSSGSICLVLASRVYSEDDYIRDRGIYSDYKK
jgi:dTDP-4-dehydrorhamnose 3,5-epimerase-like enzyme